MFFKKSFLEIKYFFIKLRKQNFKLKIFISSVSLKIKEACSLVRSLLFERIAIEEKKNYGLIRELKTQR